MKHLFWRLSSSLTISSSSRFFYPVLTVLWFWRLYVILTRESSLASHQTASAKLRQLRRHSTSLLHLKLYTCQKRLLKRCPFLDAIETNTNLVSGLDIFIHTHRNLEFYVHIRRPLLVPILKCRFFDFEGLLAIGSFSRDPLSLRRQPENHRNEMDKRWSRDQRCSWR